MIAIEYIFELILIHIISETFYFIILNKIQTQRIKMQSQTTFRKLFLEDMIETCSAKGLLIKKFPHKENLTDY